MGRDEIVRTLSTRDLTFAKRKLHAVLADIQRDVAIAEANRELSPESAQYLVDAAREARARLDKDLRAKARPGSPSTQQLTSTSTVCGPASPDCRA
jgi:hypothetical protein